MGKIVVLCVVLALSAGCTVERHYHVIEAPGALRTEQPRTVRPVGHSECVWANSQWICEGAQAPRPVYRVMPPQPVFPVYGPPCCGPRMIPRPYGVWWGIQF